MTDDLLGRLVGRVTERVALVTGVDTRVGELPARCAELWRRIRADFVRADG